MEPDPGVVAPEPAEPGSRPNRRERRHRLRRAFGTKLLTTFAVLLTLVTGLVFGLAFWSARTTTRHLLESELGEHLEAVARLAADRLDRPLYIDRAAPPGSAVMEGHPAQVARELARRNLERLCVELAHQAGVSEVVLFVESDQPPFHVLASSAGQAQREQTLARLLTDSVDIGRARATGRPTTSSLYTVEVSGFRTAYKSAYAPIKDKEGRVLALVGVELPARFPASMRTLDARLTMLGALAGLAVLGAAVLLVRQRVHVPIFRLMRAMDGEDGRPQRARVRRDDEIGALTDRYNEMVDRLAEQDQTLRTLYTQARATARYLEGYSNHLVAGVPSGVVAVDPQGTLTVWNRSATAILSLEPPLGARVEHSLGDEHPLARALRAALQGSVTDQALVALGGEDEDEAEPEPQRLVELSCAPFRDGEGELLGAVALVNDRTELERFRRAASRNERLAAIGNLGAGLAHEIKNPLGAISGFAELIERKEGADAARLARRLRGEVEALNTFLNEFLAFARGDAIRREPTELDRLVRRVIDLAVRGEETPAPLDAEVTHRQVTLPSGGLLQVRLDLAPLPRLALDPHLLRAALLNLAVNAVQAMPDGGELTVRTHRLGDSVFVRFRDTGPGVPLELREQIFDALFTTRAEGTGLGLAIANKTVSAHGGKLSVRDAPGGGAEFVVRLPVVAVASTRGGGKDTAAGPDRTEGPAAP